MNPKTSDSKVYFSPTGRGVDVASMRLDDLDKKTLALVAEMDHSAVLDLGCGLGGVSLKLAQAGAQVVAIDQHDFSEHFTRLRTEAEIDVRVLQFQRGEIADLPMLLKGQVFDLVYSQRTWHYLPYAVALESLQYLRKHTKYVCISVMGLESEAGVRYKDASRSVHDRFCSLAPDIAAKLQIHETVCLYTKAEFETLLTTAGFTIKESWQSAFGNVRVICI